VQVYRTHEPVSKLPEYLELNRAFVRSVLRHAGEPRVVLDVACGIGTLACLLISEIGSARPLKLVEVDDSVDSLRLAREELAAAWPGEPLVVGASGDRLPLPDGVADLILVGNAIHLFADKRRMLLELRRVLRPGGVLAFNTAFYEESRPGESGRFYDTWAKRAFAEVRRATGGERPARTPRATAAPPNPMLSLSEYRTAVEASRYRIVAFGERTLEMGREYLEAIASYSEFAAMQLRGYPVPLACQAFVSTVVPTLAESGIETVPRRWLEVTAVAD
jgi:ubiquinone/menaquinone biosynthesis C-methylase UbiE